MPLTRRSSASSGGSAERPAEAASALVDVGVHDLAARVDPGVGPAGADQRARVGARSAVSSAVASSPCTVRSPGCAAQPWKSVPS